jgi:hypothetical protein
VGCGRREFGSESRLNSVRKIEWIATDVYAEGGEPVEPVLRRVAALVVIANPAIGAASDAEGLRELAETATAIGESVMPRLASMLQTQAASYGKAAIVGTDGALEHGAALIHPTLGKPMRAAIGGGGALIPSNVKLGVPGTQIDVPLGHRNDPWSFDEIDTVTVGLGDAPRAAEIVLVMALASAGRPRARVRKPE